MEKGNLIMKLLTKLKEKFNSTSVKKVVVGLLLSASILTAVGCSCANQPTTPIDTSTNITQSQNGNTGTQNSTSQYKVDYSKYTPQLQSVLKDPEINKLVDTLKNSPTTVNVCELNPHPWNFLKNEGVNINAIKSGEIKCTTRSYVKDNEPHNLYMTVSVENNDGNLTQYHLKRTLTEKQMTEYIKLHNVGGKNFYIQAVFMNNQYADSQVEVLSKTTITKESYNNLLNFLVLQCKYSKSTELVLTGFDEESKTFTLTVCPGSCLDNQMGYASKNVNNLELYAYDIQLSKDGNLFTFNDPDITYTKAPEISKSTFFNAQDPFLSIHTVRDAMENQV